MSVLGILLIWPSVCLAASETKFLQENFEQGIQTKFISDITFNMRLENFRSAMFRAMTIKNGVIYSVERITVDPGLSLISFATSLNSTLRLEGENIKGAEDPRIFLFQDSVYVLFITTWCASLLGYERGLAITPFEVFRPVCLHFPGMRQGPKVAEKNWAPLVKKDNLYFVYTIDPLIVLSYDLNANGSCTIHYDESAKTSSTEKFSTSGLRIRGGSNFVHHSSHYFISSGHSYEWIKALGRDKSIHLSHLIVIDTLDWKVVYISKPIAYEYSQYSHSPLLTLRNNTAQFLRPTAFLRKWNTVNNILLDINGWDYCVQDPVSLFKFKGVYYMTISVANVCSLLYEIDLDTIFRGRLKDIISIHSDRQNTTSVAISGLSIGYWNNLVLESIRNLTSHSVFKNLYDIQRRIPY